MPGIADRRGSASPRAGDAKGSTQRGRRDSKGSDGDTPQTNLRSPAALSLDRRASTNNTPAIDFIGSDPSASPSRRNAPRMSNAGAIRSPGTQSLQAVGNANQAINQMRIREGSIAPSSTQMAGLERSLPGKRNKTGGKQKEKKSRDDELRRELQEQLEREVREYDAELVQWQELYRRDMMEAEEDRRAAAEREEVIKDWERKLQQKGEEHQQYIERTLAYEEEMQQQLTRLTIERHELTQKNDGFEAIRSGLEHHNAALEQRVQSLEYQVREMEREHHSLEHKASMMEQNLRQALNMARRDNLALRMTHTAQERELRARMVSVEEDLQQLITRVEESVSVPTEVRLSATEHLNESIDLLRIRYQDLLQQCRLKASRLSEDLIKVSSLHSNIPEYIKANLATQTDDQLRRLIDTLAFDESVRQYLEALFPPPFESKYQPRCPDTPSAVLAHGDMFQTANKQRAKEQQQQQEQRHKKSADYRPQTAPGPSHSSAVRSVRADERIHMPRPQSTGVHGAHKTENGHKRHMLGNLATPLDTPAGTWHQQQRQAYAVPGRVLPGITR